MTAWRRGCLHIKDLETIDLSILEAIVAEEAAG